AFDRIRSTLGRGQTKTEWEFLGKKVCVSAWKKLHALGTGRFNRLVAAARAGEIVAPVDLRYLSKGLPAQNSNNSSRTRIVSFLRGIYESVAETLPDIKDEPGSGVDVTAITLGDPEIEDDPYVKALTDDTILTKQKHQRKRRFNLCLNTSRTKDSEEVRWLPPGHIRDFYEQMCALLAVPGYSICVPGVDSWQLESQWCSKELEGVAERNPIAADFADKILRHLPILRENPYNLHAAADHLESWVLGSLPRAPLLDVTGMGAMTADDRRSATHYVGRAKRRVALTAAAQAWAAGVPWAEALRICKRAVSRASPKAKALPKRRARR
ncbi:FO synthase subunit 1, partial [Durusdinium trenchii]